MRPGRGAAPLVYLVTDRRATLGRPLASVIAAALQALPATGFPPHAVAVQLREKDLEARALLELARGLSAVTSLAGARLFVNDRVDVALAARADGVHLGQGALSPDDVRALAPTLAIAVSTHAPREVERADSRPGAVAFAVLGPIFDTPSKRPFGPPLGIEALATACAGSLPVVAIGGVTSSHVACCFAAGAAGIACIRDVLADPDPRAALTRIFEAIERT